MEGRIFDAAGRGWRLPTLLRWDVRHGFCSPCDSFEVAFVYTPPLLEKLRAACRFQGVYQGGTVFYGVVDEIEVTADSAGCLAVLRGRGLQALLLDAQAESADYAGADLEFILARHTPGLESQRIQRPGGAAQRSALSVDSGESHWSVLARFCQFGLGLRPRFTPEGTLVLDGADSGRRLQIDGRTALSSQRFTQDRYGVLGKVLVKNRVWGSTVTVEDPTVLAMGGHGVRVVNVPRYTGFDAMRHTGDYQLKKSKADMIQCRTVLAEPFAAFPGDRVYLAETPLGVQGTFAVESSRSFADGKKAGTVLELRPAEV